MTKSRVPVPGRGMWLPLVRAVDYSRLLPAETSSNIYSPPDINMYQQAMRNHLLSAGRKFFIKPNGCFICHEKTYSCLISSNISMPLASPVKRESHPTASSLVLSMMNAIGHPNCTFRSLICTSCSHQVSLSDSTNSVKGNDSCTDTKGQSPKSKSSQNGDSDRELPEVFVKQVPDAQIHWEYRQDGSSSRVYDVKPIKVRCVEGKMYMWCICGNSRAQPFCDGAHRRPQNNTKLLPVPWKCTETGQYWFCNCKQSKNRPFCDGSHLNLPDTVTPVVKV